MTEAAAAERPFEKLSLLNLYQTQETVAGLLEAAKTRVAEINAELGRRFDDSVKRSLDQAGKSHGTVTLELQDGFKAKAEVKQTVSWDSAALMKVAAKMPWDRVQALFDVKFSMKETTYKGICATADPALRTEIDNARTVKFGEPKIALTRDEG